MVDKDRRGHHTQPFAETARAGRVDVTGDMRTDPTAVLKVILDLPPSHIHVRKCSLLEGIRISQSGKLLPGNWVGHEDIESTGLKPVGRKTPFVLHSKVNR
ncbi:uncharacterized protein LOC123307576 [Coccinella septempunctata]|nr:uncharacterized protein LOC123307576 [Coccinella septempunctata]